MVVDNAIERINGKNGMSVLMEVKNLRQAKREASQILKNASVISIENENNKVVAVKANGKWI